LMIFPLAMFLVVMARPIIVLLFTPAYEASVPIFMLWSLTMLASVFVVDGMLRAFAQTRYLLAQNLLHLAIVVALAGSFLRLFGLEGAVLVTLLATLAAKSLGVLRISRLLQIRWQDALPWRRLAIAASCAVIAAAPAFGISHGLPLPPVAALLLAAVAYALAYVALCYAVFRRGLTPAVSATI
jgi:O-antigen/teichoic acid export membrane protein